MITYTKISTLVLSILFISTAGAQSDTTHTETSEKKYQAKAPKTQAFGEEAFAASDHTTVRWLGMAGFLINTPHCGSIDAPDFAPFNGDPENLKKSVVNPERIQVLAPGQPYTITRLKK